MPLRPATREGLKRRAAVFSLGYNLSQALLKLAGAVLTGSIALFSEAAHSSLDVVASTVALLSVRASETPADEDHNYGHGKVESVAALAESAMLLFVVGYVVFEGIHRLVSGHREVRNVDVGLAVMLVSTVSSLVVARYVKGVAAATDSVALRSNAQHLMVDFWTSVGVLASLAATRLTGWAQADSWMAIGIGGWLALGAARMGRDSFQELIDRTLPEHEVARVRKVLESEDEILSYHKLRTRHAGHMHYVDVHIVVPRDWSLLRAHDLADRVEKRIEAALAPAVAVIHVDPG